MNDNLYNNSSGINGTCRVKNESRSRKSRLYHIIILTTAGINIIKTLPESRIQIADILYQYDYIM